MYRDQIRHFAPYPQLLRPPVRARGGVRRLFLRGGVFLQEAALSDRGKGVCCRRRGGDRRHDLPAIARPHLSLKRAWGATPAERPIAKASNVTGRIRK